MKKIMPVLLLIVFLSNSLFAQDNAISKYFSHHLENPAFEQFKVSEESFEQFAEMETKEYEEQQILEAIADLEGVLVLSKKTGNNDPALYYDAVNKIAADANYEELVTVEHQTENVQILIREDVATIREFLLIAGSEHNFVIASLYGDIDLPKIMQLGKSLKHNSRNWFELVEDENTKELVFKAEQVGQTPSLTIGGNLADFEAIQVYPNIVLDRVNIQDKAAKDGTFQLEFFSLLGEPIQKIDQVRLPHTLEFNALPSGAYYIRLTNKEGAYKNFRIVKP